LPLDESGWRTRILFADCAGSGTADPSVPDDSTSQGDPPPGWCWI
jgi:hypothetical protein